ncbi:MAG: RNA polymerase sporulation sigma factor SigG [Turicibacter sp.]|nr:RNA polymerase sporulation sigma factor SigG [Turicibacter sp.]
MSKHKVDIVGVDTAKLEVLTNPEMVELFKKFQSGNHEAREILIKGNLRLVLSIIKKFNHRGENLDDLFQVGCLGLMKAIDHFDLSHEVRFSTYAVPMIIGEIRRYLRDNNSLRVSRSLRDTAYKVLQVKDQLSIELQRDPTNEEIAAVIGVEPVDVVLSVEAISDPVSIFSPIYSDGGDTIHLIDQIRDESITDEKWSMKLMLEEGFKCLGFREKQIIHDRYFMGKTQMEIAAEIGISQAQVSRLEKNALQLMEELMKS